MTDNGDRARLKIDQVVTDLERLKLNVADIEARYQILGNDFSRLCSEFLDNVKIENSAETSAVQDLENEKIVADLPQEQIIQKDPVLSSKTEPENLLQKAFDEHFQTHSVYSTSLSDIMTAYTPNNKPKEDIVLPAQENHKNAIDILADGIERGLDIIGDCLMFPIVKVIGLIKRHN